MLVRNFRPGGSKVVRIDTRFGLVTRFADGQASGVHMAVNTLGHLLALVVTPANVQERAQVVTLANRRGAASPPVVRETLALAYTGRGLRGAAVGFLLVKAPWANLVQGLLRT